MEFRLRAPCCRPLFHTLLENQRGKQVLHSPEPLILPFEWDGRAVDSDKKNSCVAFHTFEKHFHYAVDDDTTPAWWERLLKSWAVRSTCDRETPASPRSRGGSSPFVGRLQLATLLEREN